ncbi:hypothetical protein ACKKBG_A00015 [Auxenochlorella protothecoides x Auxenochlorella symbiontica]
MVPYRQDLADPVAFASNVACAQAAAAAGLWDGAFAAFASVTAVGGFPAQLQVASVGLPDPPSGDVAVTLGTPPLATPVRLGIEVERAVTRLSVALSLPGQAAVARVLVAAAVDGATNASGGEEPSRATFVVVAAAAPARLAEAQALLQPSGPGSAASSAPSPQVADLTLTVRARHTHPDGSATPGRHAVDRARRHHAAGPRRLLCRGQRHPGGDRCHGGPTVRLRDPSGTATTAHVDATWEATGGGGAVTPAATAAARLHRAARGRG